MKAFAVYKVDERVRAVCRKHLGEFLALAPVYVCEPQLDEDCEFCHGKHAVQGRDAE